MLGLSVSAGRSGRENTQIRAHTEADGDFTPAWEKKRLFNIKPQQIIFKPAGQTQKGITSLGKRPASQDAGEIVNQAKWKVALR